MRQLAGLWVVACAAAGLLCGPAAAGDFDDCLQVTGPAGIEACSRVINSPVSGQYSRDELADAYCARGQGWYEARDYAKALEDFSLAVELDAGDRALALSNRGNVYFMRNDYDQAIAEYSRAIGTDRTMTSAYTSRGLAYERKGRKDLAIESYRLALSVPRTRGDGKWAQDKAQERLSALGAR